MPFEVAQSQAFVGASIGIAAAPADALAGVELTRKADIALYEAKAAGRNQYKIFENRMSEAVRRRQTMEEELREALSRSDGLDVEFVPIVRSDGSHLVGVTAEIVWTHSSLGKVEPERFIPVAESCGLIEPLGEFVLQTACRFGASRPRTARRRLRLCRPVAQSVVLQQALRRSRRDRDAARRPRTRNRRGDDVGQGSQSPPRRCAS